MAKICRECLKKYSDEAKFCADCGVGLEYIQDMEDADKEIIAHGGNDKAFSDTVINTNTENQSFTEEKTSSDDTYSERDGMENGVIEPQPENTAEEKVEEEKIEYSEIKEKKSKNRIKPLNVLAAIFLAVFLFANYVLVVGVSGLFGFCISDVASVRIGKGAESFVISDLADALEDTFNDDFKRLVDDIAKSKSIDVTANGERYKLTVPYATSSFLKRAVYELDELIYEFEKNSEDVLEDAAKAVGAVGAYVFVTTVFTFVTLVICLGKKRRTLVFPGVMLMLVGITSLVLSMIAAFAPTVFDSSLVVFLFSFNGVVISTLIASAAMSVVGMFLAAIGITGKKE